MSTLPERTAVIAADGTQYKVRAGDTLFIAPRQEPIGEVITFPDVRLLADDSSTIVGKPTIPGAYVRAQVLAYGKGEKVIVFKKKRRKRYAVKRGYRKQYTKIAVLEIARDI